MMQTVIYFVDGAHYGGTEQVALEILARLDRRRWRPVLFHHPEEGLRSFLEAVKGLDVQTREVPRVQGHMSLLAWLPRVAMELRAERPALFHAHLNSPLSCRGALIAAAVAQVPAIVATAHLFMELPVGRFVRAQQRLAATFVDRYIAVSDAVAGRLRRIFRIPSRKIDVIHNGISAPRFDVPVKPVLRAALTEGAKRSIVLTTARLHRQKGHQHLLQAAALVPEAVFVFVGEGPERASLESQARMLGVNNQVRFLGYRQDVPDLLACSDLFVLPSLISEGFPLSVLEAMAAGKPVIGSTIEGISEAIVDGETGLLVPQADPVALAAAIRRLLANPQLASRMGAAGKGRVQKDFSAEGMVQRVTQTYDQILSPP